MKRILSVFTAIAATIGLSISAVPAAHAAGVMCLVGRLVTPAGASTSLPPALRIANVIVETWSTDCGDSGGLPSRSTDVKTNSVETIQRAQNDQGETMCSFHHKVEWQYRQSTKEVLDAATTTTGSCTSWASAGGWSSDGPGTSCTSEGWWYDQTPHGAWRSYACWNFHLQMFHTPYTASSWKPWSHLWVNWNGDDTQDTSGDY